MKTLKVGIIGCGWFGNFHLENLQRIDGVEIVALASPNAEKLKATGKKAAGACLYASHRELYEHEKLDAVIISVPPDQHDDAEILAAQKGIHIYVEKPIELSLKKAQKVDAAIEASGIISSVGYQERYNEQVGKIKEYIVGKKIGLANAKWMGGMPETPWWRAKERSGGQIVEQSTHLVDMLRFLLGDAEFVYSAGGKGIVKDVPGYNIEDYSSTIISFQSGVLASLSTACYMEDINTFCGAGFQLVCSDIIIEYDWVREFRYITKDSVQKIPFKGNSHLEALRSFIEAVRTGNRSLIKSQYSDAIKTLEITLAANESIQNHKPVILSSGKLANIFIVA